MTTKRSLNDYVRKPAAPAAVAVAEPPSDAAKESEELLKPITVKVSRANKKRLQQLAIHEDTSLQDLGVEGFNLVLKARGLPPLE